MTTISAGMCSRLSGKTNDNEGRDFQFRDKLPKRRHYKQQVEVEVQTIKVGLYVRHHQAPHTPPPDALVLGISWRVPIGVSMRKSRSRQ